MTAPLTPELRVYRTVTARAEFSPEGFEAFNDKITSFLDRAKLIGELLVAGEDLTSNHDDPFPEAKYFVAKPMSTKGLVDELAKRYNKWSLTNGIYKLDGYDDADVPVKISLPRGQKVEEAQNGSGVYLVGISTKQADVLISGDATSERTGIERRFCALLPYDVMQQNIQVYYSEDWGNDDPDFEEKFLNLLPGYTPDPES